MLLHLALTEGRELVSNSKEWKLGLCADCWRPLALMCVIGSIGMVALCLLLIKLFIYTIHSIPTISITLLQAWLYVNLEGNMLGLMPREMTRSTCPRILSMSSWERERVLETLAQRSRFHSAPNIHHLQKGINLKRSSTDVMKLQQHMSSFHILM